MSLQEILKSYTGSLTEADQRVIQVILSNPTESAFMSVGDVAKRANIHTTSAIRFAQKLGFDGYPQLREALQNEVINVVNPIERRQRRLDHVHGGSILEDLAEQEIKALQQLSSQVSQQQIDYAAGLIGKVRHVFIFGLGNSRPLVELFSGQLRRLGFVTTVITQSDRETAERLTALGKKDVVISFALRLIPKELESLLEHAKESGAKSIIISDHIGHSIRPKPDSLLMASRGDLKGASKTLVVPMAVGKALLLSITEVNGQPVIESLERYNKLTKIFSHF